MALNQQTISLGFQSPHPNLVPLPLSKEPTHRLALLSLTLCHGVMLSMGRQSFSLNLCSL
jgi:hypothetical protein